MTRSCDYLFWILKLSGRVTTRHGTKSVVYTASKAWNSLPDTLRCMKTLKDFKIAVRSIVNLHM